MNNKNLLIGAVVLGIIVIVMMQGNFIGSILPAGQSTNDPNCIFTTNVDPYNSGYNTYQGSAWIGIDYNNDNIKEAFGYISVQTGSTGIRLNSCGRDGASKLLFQDFNSAGDDIYYYYTGGNNRIYMCASNGERARYFQLGSTTSTNAILTCGPVVCTPLWQCIAWSGCVSSQQTRTCTDSNNCGTLDGKPATSQSCTAFCNTPSDTNCDSIVSRTEIGTSINNWIAGTMTRSDLGNAIQAWALG